MKVVELRTKTVSELVDMLKNLQRERMNLRFQRAAKEAVSNSRIRAVRRSIAKVKTVLTELNLRGNNA